MTRATIHAVRPEDVVRTQAGASGSILGGKYRLEAAIARGGMARVWRATHTTLNRPVAVKFVDSFGSTEEERIERFLKEAKVAASVRHKNVVDIIDFGMSRDGEPYMVMELLEGETLDNRLSRGSMNTDEAIDVALQILSGLDAVHRAGIVHRDLKPGNVFLTDDNDGVFARLLDFGISQGADDGNYSEERIVVGTPEYMSPEQAFGEPLDARSDLYSLGVLLYEMLSGTLPFEDADPQKVVEMVAHGTPPPLHRLRPDIVDVCMVVDRAMAHEAADRFSTARDMRRALLDAIGVPESTGRHISAIPRDSRVSGLQSRASGGVLGNPSAMVATLAEGELVDPGLYLANDKKPTKTARNLSFAALLVLLLLVGGAVSVAILSSESLDADDDPRAGSFVDRAVTSPQLAVPSDVPPSPVAVMPIPAEPLAGTPGAAESLGDEPEREGSSESAGSEVSSRSRREESGRRSRARRDEERTRSAEESPRSDEPAAAQPARSPGIVRDLDF